MATVLGNGPTAALGFYVAPITDVVGVVGPNTYFAVYNPPASGCLHVAFDANIVTYAVGVTSTAVSLVAQRFTSFTGGTITAANLVGRFETFMPDPRTQVITAGPTLIGAGPVLDNFAPPISTGAGATAGTGRATTPGASFALFPGQGLAFSTTAGDVDQRWNMRYVFAEYLI